MKGEASNRCCLGGYGERYVLILSQDDQPDRYH